MIRKILIYCVLMLILMSLDSYFGAGICAGEYKISNFSFSCGANDAFNAAFSGAGTYGQPMVQSAADDKHTINSGFWCLFEYTIDCCVMAGDANDDNQANVGDAVFLINFVFKSGPSPACFNSADANFDCGVNVGDAVFLINFIFKGGAAPACGCAGI